MCSANVGVLQKRCSSKYLVVKIYTTKPVKEFNSGKPTACNFTKN